MNRPWTHSIQLAAAGTVPIIQTIPNGVTPFNSEDQHTKSGTLSLGFRSSLNRIFSLSSPLHLLEAKKPLCLDLKLQILESNDAVSVHPFDASIVPLLCSVRVTQLPLRHCQKEVVGPVAARA